MIILRKDENDSIKKEKYSYNAQIIKQFYIQIRHNGTCEMENVESVTYWEYGIGKPSKVHADFGKLKAGSSAHFTINFSTLQCSETPKY